MLGAWKTVATVKPGGVIELVVPDLRSGEEVEVTVRRNGAGPSLPAAKRPGYGADRGLIVISEDFDQPIDDFREYM